MPTKSALTKEKKEKKTPRPKSAAPKAAPKPRAPKKIIEEEQPHKLRIRVRAYEHKLLDASVRQIMDTALRHEGVVIGPVPLPTEKTKFTVNRSSFIDKNSREQFEMRVHKRVIDILGPSPKLIEALTSLSLPSGVNIEVKML